MGLEGLRGQLHHVTKPDKPEIPQKIMFTKLFLGYVNEDGSKYTGGTPPPRTTKAPVVYLQSTPATMDIKTMRKPCAHTDTAVSLAGSVCQGNLLFEDTFDMSLDDGHIWKKEHKIAGEPVSTFLNLDSIRQSCQNSPNLQ